MRTDTILGHSVEDIGGVERKQFYFIRDGYDSYRQLSAADAKAVLHWVDTNGIDVDEMTIGQCEEAIENARRQKSEEVEENLCSEETERAEGTDLGTDLP